MPGSNLPTEAVGAVTHAFSMNTKLEGPHFNTHREIRFFSTGINRMCTLRLEKGGSRVDYSRLNVGWRKARESVKQRYSVISSSSATTRASA